LLDSLGASKRIPGRPHPEAAPRSNEYAPLPNEVTGELWLTCPVLVFNAGYGKIDAGDPPHTTKGWGGGPLKASNYRFVLVRKSGHWIWLDQPDLFLKEIRAFLDPLAPPSGKSD